MKVLLKIEEAFMFILSIFLFSKLGFSWWWFPALLFTPDIGMIGYAVNPAFGAVIYNFIHHRALSVSLYITGSLISIPLVQLIGIIMFAHSTMDRFLGYGLKYTDNFKHTHLSS